jgi:hydroxyacylglutathione hydrolase
MYLTHFGQIRDVVTKAAELHRFIDAYVVIARRENNGEPDRHARIRQGLAQLRLDEVRRWGCRLPMAKILEVFTHDLELDAQGLGVWLDSQA